MTITTEAALRDFLAEIATCGFLAIDTETDGLDRVARAAGRACRWRWRRGAPPIVPLRHEGLAEQVPLAAAIAALGPVLTDPRHAEDLPERQVRHAGDGACRLPAGRAVRRCDADLLRPGGRHARPRAGRTGAAASRPHADQLRRGHRHRAQPHSVLAGADRARHRLCRRGCRCGAAAVAGAAAAAALQRRAGAVRAGGAAAAAGAAGDGARRHQGRRRRPAAHVGGLRAAHGGDRARHPSPRRPRIQRRFGQAARRGAVRRDEAGRRASG